MAVRSRPDLVSALEAAYAVDRSDRDWLEGLMDAIRPSIDAGLGIAGYLYDTRDRPFRVRHLLVADCPVDEAGIAMLNDEAHDDFVRSSWIARSAMMASETPGYHAHPGVLDVLQPAGIRDILVINAIDPIGVGCWIGAPLPTARALDDAEREQWNRVAAHVRSSLRLRLRLATRAAAAPGAATEGAADAEALITARGKIEHVEGAAVNERAALRSAALDIAQARTELRSSPARALSAWKALVRGRWTLVDEFRADGSQYVVARVNTTVSKAIDRLSERERQVVGCLSMGLTNKEVAYELGLAHSTVRVLVARASAKLEVKTCEALVERYRRDTLA